MDNPFSEVPVLPVVIPLGVVVLAILVWRLLATRSFSLPRAAVAAALAIYAAGIVANTVFPIYLDKPDRVEPWTPYVALIPFADYELADALMNVAVFVPLGILIPLVLTRPTWWKVISITVAASVTIEIAQLAVQGLFRGGHIADVSDLICNTAGGVLGYGILIAVTAIPWAARLIDRFRWASPTQPA